MHPAEMEDWSEPTKVMDLLAIMKSSHQQVSC